MAEPTELEREVARAIYETCRQGGGAQTPWDEISPFQSDVCKEHWHEMARTAIASCFRWRKIEEGAEPDGPVLLRGPRFDNPVTGEWHRWVGWALINSEGRMVFDHADDPINVNGATEWLPLPPPPEDAP